MKRLTPQRRFFLRACASWLVAASLFVVLAAVAAAPTGAASAARVKAPRSGAEYSGETRQELPITLFISGRSVEYVSFRFDCGPGATGGIGLQGIKLRKTRRGYRFASKAFGAMSVSDDDSYGENARLSVSGRFSRTARSVKGSFRVRSERCGDTGTIRWRASS